MRPEEVKDEHIKRTRRSSGTTRTLREELMQTAQSGLGNPTPRAEKVLTRKQVAMHPGTVLRTLRYDSEQQGRRLEYGESST